MAAKKKAAASWTPEEAVAFFAESPPETRAAELIERLGPIPATPAIACGVAVLERFPVSAVAAYLLGRTLSARADGNPDLATLEARMRALAEKNKVLAAVFAGLD